MAARPTKSLFLELLLFAVVVLVLAFAANAVLAIRLGREPLERLVRENLSRLAHSALEDVDRHLSRCEREIQLWSKLSMMDDVLINDRNLAITNLLIGLQRDRRADYLALIVLDLDGAVVASTDPSAIERRNVLDDLDLHPVESGELLAGRLESGAGTPEDALVLAHPVESALTDEPIGWLLAYLRWSTVRRIVTEFEIEGRTQDLNRFLLLIDARNKVLAGDTRIIDGIPRLDDAVLGLPRGRVVSRAIEPLGAYLLASAHTEPHFSPLSRELRVVALWHQAEAFQTLGFVTRAVLYSALLGIALAATACLVIARRVSRRVRALTEGTARLAEGDLAHRVEEGRDDELGGLARSFNHMAQELSQAKARVDATVARWRSVVEHAPDIIVTLNRDGSIRFINRAFLARDPEHLVGSSIYDFIPRKHHAKLGHVLERVFRNGEAASLEFDASDAHGSITWYATHIGPIKAGDRVDLAILIGSDITDRKLLERKFLEVAEIERGRIGQDLHDGLGQVLAGTALLSKGLQKRLRAKRLAEATEAQRIIELINKAMEHTRSLAKGLFPIALEREGIQGALEELASGVESVFGVSCRVEGRTLAGRDDRSQAMHVFRIVQEAVNNSLRHSKAKSILIQIGTAGESEQICIRDDGKGFKGVAADHPGLGLRLMQYRASLIGASVEVESQPGKGTVVTCRL